MVGETVSGAMAGCPTSEPSSRKQRRTIRATLQFLTHITALRAHNLDKDVRQRFEYQLKAIARNAPGNMDVPVIETQPMQSTSSSNVDVPVSPLSIARRKSQAYK